MKKIIVAGGNGFIGSYICNILSKKGFYVFSIDNNTIYVKKPYDFDFYENSRSGNAPNLFFYENSRF